MTHCRIALICIVLLTARSVRAGDDLRRYEVVNILPVKTSIYIGSVSLAVTPFLHKDGVFISTYSAKVFPYFFYNEQGKLSIPMPDQTLVRLTKGETITFAGKGVSDDGQERVVDGKATATGPDGGKIKVRVFVSKKIALVFNTTYVLANPKPVQPSAH